MHRRIWPDVAVWSSETNSSTLFVVGCCLTRAFPAQLERFESFGLAIAVGSFQCVLCKIGFHPHLDGLRPELRPHLGWHNADIEERRDDFPLLLHWQVPVQLGGLGGMTGIPRSSAANKIEHLYPTVAGLHSGAKVVEFGF